MKLKIFCSFCYLILYCQNVSIEPITRQTFIVWDVGQGLWISLSLNQSCLHFDSGGERRPPKQQLFRYCKDKQAEHFLSHYDWDHRGYLPWLKTLFPKLCRHQAPRTDKPELIHKYQELKRCTENNKSVDLLFPLGKQTYRKSNDNSQVFLWQHILFPGDSTKKTEALWANHRISGTRWLILGHHGSKTSTSAYLLSQLPKLSVAIASARKRKYKHPHPTVLKRLQRMKVPVLSTNDWGTLIFELP